MGFNSGFKGLKTQTYIDEFDVHVTVNRDIFL